MGAFGDTAVTRGSVGCEVVTRGHGRALRYRGDPAVPWDTRGNLGHGRRVRCTGDTQLDPEVRGVTREHCEALRHVRGTWHTLRHMRTQQGGEAREGHRAQP